MKGEPNIRPSIWRAGRVMRYLSGSSPDGLGTVRMACPICLILMVREKVAFCALYPSRWTPVGTFVMLYAVAGGWWLFRETRD